MPSPLDYGLRSMPSLESIIKTDRHIITHYKLPMAGSMSRYEVVTTS